MRIAVLTFEGFNELDSFIASAGGCLASHYLAAWVIARLAGWKAADSVLRYVAPVGEKPQYVERARAAIGPYL